MHACVHITHSVMACRPQVKRMTLEVQGALVDLVSLAGLRVLSRGDLVGPVALAGL